MLAALAVGCGAVPTPTPAPQSYSGVLAATEFVVGENRFPFGLISIEGGQLAGAGATVSFFTLNGAGGGEPVLRSEAHAEYREVVGVTPHEHPDGALHEHTAARGVYVVDNVTLSEPGIWVAQFSVTTADGERPRVEGLGFEVIEAPVAVGVGQLAPATRNRTIHDVERFDEVSTRLVEDDLHDLSVAQALEAGLPFLVVFASPQFCVSAMCGPLTDTVAAVQGRLSGRANFIHIEPWDLPTVRTEGRLVPSAEAVAWRLPSEPWTFVVGADGRVATRFEGLVTAAELEVAVRALLGG